jgi:phosphoribosylaminoimidazole-succinocarboxamide synthase
MDTQQTHRPFSTERAQDLAAEFITKDNPGLSTQEIIEEGLIPQLKGFTVVPGKVSDSIHGGHGSFTDKNDKIIEFENPPLNNSNGDPIRILVRTGRISTHDISRGIIPFKDQVLSLNHNFMRKLVDFLMPHAQLDAGLSDTAVVSFAKNLDGFPVEHIIRAYPAKTTTTTSIYQQYFINKIQQYCGIDLSRHASELQLNKPLPFIMDTPSSKSSKHDQSMAPEELFKGRFDKQYYRAITNNATAAFGAVALHLRQKGILLVDTKTEHGTDRARRILSMDELYTLDSSRFWKLNSDGSILMENGEPVPFSKEFARSLSKDANSYTIKERVLIAARYMESIELLTGVPFSVDKTPWDNRVVTQLKKGLSYLDIK